MAIRTKPTGRLRVFRQQLLILLSTCVALIGVALIIGAQFTKSGWHESLVAIGAAILATGPITVMVWWVTDDIYQRELSGTLRPIIAESFDQANSTIRDIQRLGITNVYLTRVHALNRFRGHMTDEIERARRGQQARLWFVCTDLKGFLEVQIQDKFDLRDILRDAVQEQGLDLRILMADPEYTINRSEDGDDSDEQRRRLYAPVKELQSEYGVEADAIRFYAYRPTVFAIATSQHMLLNPYPQGEQAHRTMSMIVTKTTASERIEDVYSQYLEDHFIKSWKAKDTREIDESPPFVSRIKLSRDGHEANGLLSKEISEARPETADLLEFSGEEVHDLLDKLTRKGTKVRLLLKHPGTVGETQRQRIINSYEYLKSHADPDSFQIRFYRFPSLIRGRRLDTRLLNVGWYTPDIISGDEWEIAGSRNPTVTSDPATPDGQALDEMFGRTFDDLWRYGIATAEVDSYIRSRHD